jgi:hypothetical protein
MLDGLEHLEGDGVLGGVMDTKNGGATRERVEIGRQGDDRVHDKIGATAYANLDKEGT